MAAIGPATSALEEIAASVAAGMVIGGFLAGLVVGWFLARRSAGLEHRVVMTGYLGGLVGLLALVNDLFGR